jgi:hypothetical protein
MICYSATVSIVLHMTALLPWHGTITPHTEVMLPRAPFHNLVKRYQESSWDVTGGRAVTMQSKASKSRLVLVLN